MYSLPSDRATVWKPGVTYNGGIPSPAWPVVKKITCTNTTADLVTVQNTINSSHLSNPTGAVVQLTSGTCNFNSGFVLIPSYTVLRGAGAGATIIAVTNGSKPANNAPGAHNDPAIIVGPARYLTSQAGSSNTGTSQSTLLTADVNFGDMSAQVTSAAGFHVGDFVLLDETSGASWQPDRAGTATSILAASDYRVTYQVHNPAYQYVDDPVAYPTTPTAANNFAGAGNGSDAASWFSRQDRMTSEIKQIASCGATSPGAPCSSTTIVFTTPAHISYRSGNIHYAELTSYSSAFVINGGVENLTVTGTDDDAIDVQWCARCWLKNVEVTQWLGHGVGFYNAFGSELRDSYVHDANWPVPGGGGYAIAVSTGSSEILVENSISIRANKVMVAQSGGAGSVIAYNYFDEGMVGSAASEEPGFQGWVEVGVNGSH
ncbi:MAG: hypothetical protein C5B49_09160, partial [Bdellovibrio sp.]